MNPLIVADIGGTNARFGLVSDSVDGAGRVGVEHRRQYPCADFEGFDSVFRCYIETLGGSAPKQACVAIAAPIKGDRVRMTNLDWEISISAARRSFGLERFEIINDYTAQVHSTLALGPESLEAICEGTPNSVAPRCVIGPGTGLGVAAIAPVNGCWATLSGEGGHVTLASTGQYENRVITQIAPEQGRVSAETVLSGPGIVRLYRAICAIEDYRCQADTPAQVTAAALGDSDPAAIAAFSVFFRLLGGFVGDMILTFGARGGVFLAGGILPRVEPLLKNSEFEFCLKNKGVMSHYLEDIHVALIAADHAALIGAATWFYNFSEMGS